MTIASRTPEGEPLRCPVCGAESRVEPAYPGGDACCERCGQLLWSFRDRLRELLGISAEHVTPETVLADLGASSLDTVELVMAMEEDFDLVIDEEDAEQMKTIADIIRYLRRLRGLE